MLMNEIYNQIKSPKLASAAQETQGHIRKYCQGLSDSIAELESSVDNLVSRLTPVSTPYPGSVEKDVGTPVTPASEVACMIDNMYARVSKVIKTLNCVNNNLDL